MTLLPQDADEAHDDQDLKKKQEKVQHPLITRLNIHDKGADCIVLQPGSHSLKFGLASQDEPFVVPSLVARPRRATREASAE